MRGETMRHAVHSLFRCGRDYFGRRAKPALLCNAAIVVLLSALPAFALTEVQGQQDNLQVQTQNASIREILDALSAKFKVTYKLSPNVSRVLTGQYSGTLRQILTRVLDGNDYIVNASDDGIEIIVLGASGTTAVAVTEQPIATKAATLTPSSAPSQPPPLVSYLSGNGPPAVPGASGSQ